MARTEKGRANRNRSPEWNPTADGRSPVKKGERLDARFVNSTSKPPRTEERPTFDRCMYVPAVCNGASCGGDAPAKIKNTYYGSTSRERLDLRARTPLNLVAATVPGAPLYFGRIAAAAIMKHKLFRNQKIKRDDGSVFIHHTLLVRHNGHLLPHTGFRCWFGKNYPWRWDQPASCYADVRIDGKATNGHDLTWSQAASRIGDEAFDNLSTRQFTGPRCPLIFYEKPILCFFLLWVQAGYVDFNITRCRTVPKADRADAIQFCMERLTIAYESWDKERGAFTAYAEQAIEWAIQNFMKEQRKQVPVQRSINLNDPAVSANDDDDDDNTPPEQPNMLKPLNALEGQANEAKRRLVADRLDCLDLRQRHVIERRLCLNGYKEPATHEALAAELGVTDRTIRRIEKDAVRKLQKAVA